MAPAARLPGPRLSGPARTRPSGSRSSPAGPRRRSWARARSGRCPRRCRRGRCRGRSGRRPGRRACGRRGRCAGCGRTGRPRCGQGPAGAFERVQHQARAVETERPLSAVLVGRAPLGGRDPQRVGGDGRGLGVRGHPRREGGCAERGQRQSGNGAGPHQQVRSVRAHGHAQTLRQPPAKGDLSGSGRRRCPAVCTASPQGVRGRKARTPSCSGPPLPPIHLVDRSSGTAAGLGARPDRPAAVAGSCRRRDRHALTGGIPS